MQGWTFDKLDRLVSAALAQGTSTYGYRANDELETITRASGVQTTLGYFPHGPLDTITTRDGSSQLLHLLDYTVDKTLNVDMVSETRGTGSSQLFDYGYDGVDRLTSALNPTAYGLPPSEDYAYDPAGNRETPGSPSAYDYDANNRITVSPGATYAFDDDGNLETKNAGLSTEERFTFDKTNRLAAWEKGPSGSATGTASYAYDPFGRRIKKTANGTTTWFLWDGDVLAAEFDGSGSRTRRYTYDGGWAPAELVTKTGGTETAYAVTTDHLDTPRMLTDAAGVAVWRSSHESFGKAVVDEDPDGDSNLVSFHVRFPGQYADAETGLHYNWNRYYGTDHGRYLSGDPIGQGGDVNTYRYVEDRPTKFVDSTGLDIIICDRGARGMPGNHSYAYDTETGRSCGTSGSSGNGSACSDPGDENAEKPENDACSDPVPGSEDENKADAVMDYLEEHANDGPWVPFANDCHNAVADALDAAGLPKTPSPNGRFGRGNPGATPSKP